jgi:hypothetical protein
MAAMWRHEYSAQGERRKTDAYVAKIELNSIGQASVRQKRAAK